MEVALRAAFKAVTDGKQVAAPTNNPARCNTLQYVPGTAEGFPVTVDYINRSKKCRQTKGNSGASYKARSTSSSGPIACWEGT